MFSMIGRIGKQKTFTDMDLRIGPMNDINEDLINETISKMSDRQKQFIKKAKETVDGRVIIESSNQIGMKHEEQHGFWGLGLLMPYSVKAVALTPLGIQIRQHLLKATENPKFKIIAYSNFNIETVADFLVCDNIKNEQLGTIMVEALVATVHENDLYYYKLVLADYKLWCGLEELI
jgi:hypothetical protein